MTRQHSAMLVMLELAMIQPYFRRKREEEGICDGNGNGENLISRENERKKEYEMENCQSHQSSKQI